MSIAQSFENLNRSLRYISDQQRMKQQNAAQHEERMLQLQDQINDPRRKLLRAQAQVQLEPTQLMNPYDVSEGSTIDRVLYESKYRGRIQGLLPDDAKLNDDGVIVGRGTDTPYTMPRWQQQDVQNKLYAAQATGDLQVAQFNREGMSAIKQLKDYRKSIKTKTPTLYQKNVIKNFQNQIDDYNETKNDPDKMASKYMSDNESLNSGIVMNAQRPNPDPKLHTMLSSIRDANTSRINAIAKGATLKNQKEVKYHKWENGSLISKSRYFPKGRPAPSVIEDGFRIGDLKWWPGKGKSLSGKDGGLTIPQKNKIRFDDTRNRVILSAAQSGLNHEDLVKSMVSGDVTKEKANNIADLITSNKDKVVKAYSELVEGNAQKNRNNPWYWTGRTDLRDEYFKKWGLTPKQKLKPTTEKKSALTPKQLLSL